MELSLESSSESRIVRVMKSLSPVDEEDYSALRDIIARTGAEALAFAGSLPGDLVRYFHGLLEAAEIYQAIHGRPAGSDLSESVVQELRQIRDLCLLEVSHSIY